MSDAWYNITLSASLSQSVEEKLIREMYFIFTQDYSKELPSFLTILAEEV
jgi:hypothetical protein